MVSGSVLFLGLRDYQAMERIIIPWINREVSNLIWLVVWIMNFIFPYIGNVIIPTDELHHFSEGQVYHQPVTLW